LRIRYDDGFAVYVNGGTPVASANAPNALAFNSSATALHDDPQAMIYETYDVSAAIPRLVVGDNLLAVHGLNDNLNSSDFLIDLLLEGGQSAVTANSGITASAIEYTGPITLTGSTTVTARTFDPAGPFDPPSSGPSPANQIPVGSGFSAPSSFTYLIGTVPPTSSNLVVSEVMYHPLSPTPEELAAGFTDQDEFEFVELMNVGNLPVNLTGIQFTTGIGFTMDLGPGSHLAPGATALIVENREAFTDRYGSGLPIIGQFTDKLNNDGETLTFADAAGTILQNFTYNDQLPWPTAADGSGRSLELIDPDSEPDHGVAANWKASLETYGTPGGWTITGYPTWASLLFPNGGGESNPEADPDDDGLSNLLEFYLASDPFQSSHADLPCSEINGDEVTVRFTRRTGITGAEARIETSTDLENWITAGTAPTITVHGDGTETVSYTSIGNPADVRQFLRLRVILP
ncbi:MAG: lamin tail domain-containing protein, partial [Verrucomicrobiota bacterium]